MAADSPASEPPARLQLAGVPRLVHEGREWPLQPVDAALLVWLALRGPTPRGRLAELLWPGSEAESARGALRQRLYKLRQTVGFELASGQATLALAAGVGHDLDVADTVLDGCAVSIGGEFGQWLATERERRRGDRRARLDRAIDTLEAAGELVAALQHALEALQAEPEREEAHRRVIRLHYLLGDRAAARAAYQRCVQMLQRTLGVAPAAETEALRRLVDGDDALPARRHPGTPSALPPALLRPPRMVGREAESAAARAAWAQGKVVALVAEAGMGKTRLLQQLVAGQPGALYVAARPGDAGVPLATLARLLRALDGGGADAAPSAWMPLLPGLPAGPAPGSGMVTPMPTPTPPIGERLHLQRAVAQRLASDATLRCVAVDDLHFADSASLHLLQSLLDDGSEPGQAPDAAGGAVDARASRAARPLRWAVGYRPADAGGALRELQDALLDRARLQPLLLAPLDRAAVAELVDSLEVPGLRGADLAAELLQRTGGNPLYVLETLREGFGQSGGVAAAAGRGGRLGRPSSVLRLIERRLAQLTPAALALARCAAVAGTSFSTGLATVVLQTPAIALADAWAELEAAGVLRDQAFAHDLVYEATLASIPAAIARHLHGEVAAWLEREVAAAASTSATAPTPPATLARHWLAAGRPERASIHLEHAAQAAAQAYDVSEAARLWSQLAELHREAGQAGAAFEAALAAANALRSQTTGAEIEAAIARLEALAHAPLQHAAVAKQRAELCLARGDVVAAAAHTAAGIEALGPEAPLGARAALLNSHGVLLRRLGRYPEARATLEQAVALVRALPPDQPVASAHGIDADLPSLLNNLGLVLQEQDEHLAAIALLQEASERQGDPTTRARVLNNLAISLEERGQVALAYEQRLAAARAVAGSGGLVEASVAISLGATARSLARYREAMAHLERASALSKGTRFHRDEDLQRNWSTLWLALGRVNLAREALDRAEAATNHAAELWVIRLGRARLHLAMQQPEAARALIDAVHRAWTEAGYARALRRVLVLRAAVLSPEQALPELQQALALPAVQANPGAALQLLVRLAQVQLALGEHAPALRAAERAADWLAVVQPLDLSPAEVWLTLARTAEAAGERDRAGAAARQGLRFVDAVAREHLDEMYRESWRGSNAVNAELARIGARLAG